MNNISERSFEPIEKKDLEHLANLANEDLRKFFDKNRETGRPYKDRPRMLCLCQGSAEHFVHCKHRRYCKYCKHCEHGKHSRHGVKDFDVWAFFPQDTGKKFPPRRRVTRDFWRHPDGGCFKGRRVDIIGRSIECNPKKFTKECVQKWLREGKTCSAKLIAQRPVVVIYPDSECGTVIWDGVGEVPPKKKRA